MGREIGKVIEVRGVYVRAELYDLLPPYIVEKGIATISPRINSFVKTRVGLDTIICQITGEYYDEMKKGTFSGFFVDLAVKGYIDNNSFVQGVRMLPMVSASIELLDAEEFKRINECAGIKSFSLGTNLFDNTQRYFLDYNSIIPSHIGIFGNTGSGKSNTLAKLLNSYAEVLRGTNNGKILVIDINNEYGDDAICSSEMKKVYKLTTRTESKTKIPLDYSKLREDDWCILLNATEATQKPVIKTANKDSRTKVDYEKLIRLMVRTGQRELVKSMQYNLVEYIHGLDNFRWHSQQGKYYYDDGNSKVFVDENDFNHYLDCINVTIPTDVLDIFLFKLYFAVAIHIGMGSQYEFISPLLRRAEKLFADFKKVFCSVDSDIFANKKIAVIQLANVNKDMIELIPSIIVNHLLRSQVEKKIGDKITDIVNVIVDEAHNLLYEDEFNKRHTNVIIETFEKSIKEGRKFGLFLWISSQRPSDISSTIVSQMHNYFIHKLVNPNDLTKIRKAVTFLDQTSMDSLTVLGPGECIASGTGIPMPCFIKIDQLEKKYRPNSENVVLFGSGGIFGVGEDDFFDN